MKRIILVLALALGLPGCASLQGVIGALGGDTSILSGGTSIVATAPVSIKAEYTVETIYNGAMRTYREYLRLPTCQPGTTISIYNLCRDPVTVARLRQGRRDIVEPALAKARAAQRSGGINAIEVIEQIKSAIIAWQAGIPIGGQ